LTLRPVRFHDAWCASRREILWLRARRGGGVESERRESERGEEEVRGIAEMRRKNKRVETEGKRKEEERWRGNNGGEGAGIRVRGFKKENHKK